MYSVLISLPINKGDDPWYQKASYYWPFNTLKDPGILDQRGTTSVQAYSKNGLQLDGFLGSWADLGNFSFHCISNPEACKTGFTATFWLRVDDRQNKRFVMQIGSATQAVGTTMQIDGDYFGVYVNGRATQRHVQVNWTYASWIFVALSWNKIDNKIGVLLNCSSVSYEKYNVGASYRYSSVPPNNMLILGASNARLNSIKMTIDELAIWNGVLSKQDVCYIMESKAGNMQHSIISNRSLKTNLCLCICFFSVLCVYVNKRDDLLLVSEGIIGKVKDKCELGLVTYVNKMSITPILTTSLTLRSISR